MSLHIIGISGHTESGKDEFARMLWAYLTRNYNYGCRVFRFADVIKDACGYILDWDRSALNDAEFKSEIDPKIGRPRRDALQSLGGWGRGLCVNLWCDKLFSKIEYAYCDAKPYLNRPYPRYGGGHYAPVCGYVYIIPDCRYINEAKRIVDSGGVVVKMIRDGHQNKLTEEQRKHSSETEMDSDEFTSLVSFPILNNGTLEELNAVASRLAQNLVMRWNNETK